MCFKFTNYFSNLVYLLHWLFGGTCPLNFFFFFLNSLANFTVQWHYVEENNFLASPTTEFVVNTANQMLKEYATIKKTLREYAHLTPLILIELN